MRIEPIKLIGGIYWIGKWQPDDTVELGDGYHREGMDILGFALLKGKVKDVSRYVYKRKLELLEHPTFKGFYRRSIDSDWTSDFDRYSRDQATPNVCAMGLLGLHKQLFFHLLAHVLRLGFFFNIRKNGTTKENHGTKYANGTRTRNYNVRVPDIAGPSFWAIYFRGFTWLGVLVYPILCFLDIELLLGSILWRYYRKGNDVLNYLCLTRYARARLPTPLSWLALKVEDKQLLKTKLTLYFDSSEYQPILKTWLKLI